jgi:hypothetical protein
LNIPFGTLTTQVMEIFSIKSVLLSASLSYRSILMLYPMT